MKKNDSQKNIIVHGLLLSGIVVALILFVYVGYTLLNRNTKPVVVEQSNGVESINSPQGERKTISLNDVSYSLVLPDGWKIDDSFLYPGESSNTKIATITGPNAVNQLEIQINPTDTSTRVPPLSEYSVLNKFKDASGKLFCLSASQDEKKSPQIVSVSDCSSPINLYALKDAYVVHAVLRHTSTAAVTPVDMTDTDLAVMKSIIVSIKPNVSE